MLSPSSTHARLPVQKCSASPSACAIPPASSCTRYVSRHPCSRPEPSNSTKSPMCSVPETSRISCNPAPVSFLSGWYTIGHAPTGSRCLFVTFVSSPMRVPFPPARITPRMDMDSPYQAVSGSQLAVLLLVVAQVILVLDRGDPRPVGPVPLDRLGEPAVELYARPPAQFALGFRAIDGVSAVVARAVLHVADERFRLAEQPQQKFRQLDVRHLAPPAEVVHL